MAAPRFLYQAVSVDGVGDVQAALDRMAAEGWRLAGTYESMGYTIRLIFERPVETTDTPQG